MNKKSHHIHIILLLFIIISSCKNIKEIINLKKVDTDKPVIIKMNKDLEKVTGLKLPFILTIDNLSSSKKEFIKINYNYSFKEKGVGLELYENDKKISNNKKKRVQPKSSLNYLIYTRHFTDSIKSTQHQFKPYIEKMLKENKDTLHIGTVAKFKKNHKNLFEKLTKNDSISIQLLDGKQLGERITVPVEW
jgi:hypothetical protein